MCNLMHNEYSADEVNKSILENTRLQMQLGFGSQGVADNDFLSLSSLGSVGKAGEDTTPTPGPAQGTDNAPQTQMPLH